MVEFTVFTVYIESVFGLVHKSLMYPVLCYG